MSVASDVTDLPDPSATTTTARPASSAAGSGGATRRPGGLGALLLRLHFYAGVLVAPFLVIAAVTGLLYTAVPQLDQILYGDQLTAAHTGATGNAGLPLAEQIAAART